LNIFFIFLASASTSDDLYHRDRLQKSEKPASCAAKRCRKAKMPHNSAGEGKLLTLSLQRWSVIELKAL
jgi:hypothetical protein